MDKEVTSHKVEHCLRRYPKVKQFAGKIAYILQHLRALSQEVNRRGYGAVADSFDEHLEFFSEIGGHQDVEAACELFKAISNESIDEAMEPAIKKSGKEINHNEG